VINNVKSSKIKIKIKHFRPPELESQQSKDGCGGSSSKEDSFEYPDEAEDATSDNNNAEENNSGTAKRNNADQFLVCVFNVSSKVSYSILQVLLFTKNFTTAFFNF
jgi:hypothetical protein